MTRVDFYILPENKLHEKFACALAGKARKQDLKVYIYTESREKALKLDDLLWTYKDISFLPHNLADGDSDDETCIIIGWNGTTNTSNELLINLTMGVPTFANEFDRIMEIVEANESARKQARNRYRQYRELEFELRSHDLEATHATI